jgi:hypothetical protein
MIGGDVERTTLASSTGILEALRNRARSLVRILRTPATPSKRVTTKEQDRMTDDGAPSRP